MSRETDLESGDVTNTTQNRIKRQSETGLWGWFNLDMLVLGLLVLWAILEPFPQHYRPAPGTFIDVNGTPVFVKDANYNSPYIPSSEQGCPTWLLAVLSGVVPFITVCLFSYFSKIPGDIRTYWMGMGLAFVITVLLTDSLKAYMGFWRPCYFELCGYDDATNTCTASSQDIIDAHRSFPSGHASVSFCGLLFFTLWLLGKSRIAYPHFITLFPFNLAPTSIPDAKLGKFLILNVTTLKVLCSLLPVVGAGMISATRVRDNMHHPADVGTGALLGSALALCSYFYYYPSLFHRLSNIPLHYHPQPTTLTL